MLVQEGTQQMVLRASVRWPWATHLNSGQAPGAGETGDGERAERLGSRRNPRG